MNYKKRKQYRLPEFDYSGEGEYFITICTKNKTKHFGKIADDKMILSKVGEIVENVWKEIPSPYFILTILDE